MEVCGFENITMLVNGRPMTAFDDSEDALKIEQLEDGIIYKVGADGRMVAFVSSNRSGKFTLKLWQNSPEAAFLQKQYNQQMTPGFFIPTYVTMFDGLRQDRAEGSIGCIIKPADVVRGAGINSSEWMIVVERLDLSLGTPIFQAFAGLG